MTDRINVQWTPYMLELKEKMEAEQGRLVELAARLATARPRFVYNGQVAIPQQAYAALLARVDEAEQSAEVTSALLTEILDPEN